MRLLLTNDDGVQARGLRELARELRRLGEVFIVAPEVQQSGVSHSLTLYRPLVVRPLGPRAFAVDGTPADCVKLALKELIRPAPDVVVSGINWGLNTGSNVLYSGTLAGALEAAMYGVPAFAISLEVGSRPRWPFAARTARRLIRSLLPYHQGGGLVININIPARRESALKGVLVTRQENSSWEDMFDRRKDPRGRVYYWLKDSSSLVRRMRAPALNGHVPTDSQAVKRGYVSVTPLHRDLTHHQFLPELLKRSSLLPPLGR
ncbi:MAG: 5'/3'-nucleotidase SurE [Planctomycetes bacterium]|nr:5'/3'-nucleotidase SurE [Planctomycetota bacterium]